ncbi:1,2-dihydroxy-3-keto-5-methylthiopentene dioxygenase (5-methylthio-3-oxo-1-penten-1,2-diol dioxygenase) (DHK-MTPenedioxygenase) [Sulfobacillus acidophilus TPY]|uniref:Acireductone dioxygenase n=1 Tax=Sulfobacillus acidophilus (strain ATCC 700253 / DSM 10332 / NAL) TaxID=679936 RepID=G8TT40_SULAD|nr:1,2-dihydroxy-3-keto-5-methylthiopentene dioxygenase (5-methylthio-3-oxo-1-penten-1,2-diol dioxygenase) (DHK-MTPenedioxygenase) [Sulfobacillus acidophilus TPY]AEW06740.1 acireductone dioxygenase apoprotein [Sulfobacillus acidophilus DSM 10332]
MAKVYDRTNQKEVPESELIPYLAAHGIHYEYWPIDRLPDSLRTQKTLSAEEQSQVIAAFAPELQRMSRDYGYISHDVVVLNTVSTPNLDELLANFERFHRHSEDEVRFIVDGAGVFTLEREGDLFDVTVYAGDLISVPRGTRHYFTLTETRNVKAIRLFQTREGWVAIYDEEAVS